MDQVQVEVMIAAYAVGIFVVAMATEAVKALIWVSIFMAFYRRL